LCQVKRIFQLYDSISAKTSLGQPWPLPQLIVFRQQNLSVSAEKFQFQTDSTCDTLKQAMDRYQKIIFGTDNREEFKPLSDYPLFTGLKIELDGCEKYPSMGMNENCEF